MPPRKKKALGRGMSQLVNGSFSAIVSSGAKERDSEKNRLPGRKPGATTRGTKRRAATAPSSVPGRTFDVISISSGKGGTGKSVLSSNLGVLLTAQTRVTVLDADLGLANIHILYNLMPKHDVSHVISGERTLDDVMLEGPRGVRIVPGGSGVPELASLSDMMFGSFVNGIAALDSSTDLLLVDAPSGIDRQALAFLLASDQILIVTTEDITAMTDAYAVAKTVLSKRPGATVVMVINKARSYAEGMETFQKIAHVARKFLGRELALGGIVPLDDNVERSVAERVPIVISSPDCPAARAMASIAGRIATFHARSERVGEPFATRLKGLMRRSGTRRLREGAR